MLVVKTLFSGSKFAVFYTHPPRCQGGELTLTTIKKDYPELRCSYLEAAVKRSKARSCSLMRWRNGNPRSAISCGIGVPKEVRRRIRNKEK